MKPDTGSGVFLSEKNQKCNEFGVLDETVSTERLTTILDALSAEMYLKVELEVIGDPDLSLEQILQRMMTTIFIDHSERLSVTKNKLEFKKYQESNRRARENGRESATSTAFITCHY